MIAKFDSLWGRAALLAIVVACVGLAWWQQNENLAWKVDVTGPNAGPPAVSLVGARGKRVVEAWDWRSGRRWSVPAPGRNDELAITSSFDSASIVYATATELVAVGIQPPHLVARRHHGQTGKVRDIEYFDANKGLAILRVYHAESEKADLVSVDLASGRTIDRIQGITFTRRVSQQSELLVGFFSRDASGAAELHEIRTRLDDASRFVTVDVGKSVDEFRPAVRLTESMVADLAQRKLTSTSPISPDGRFVAESTPNGDVNVIEIATGRLQSKVPAGLFSSVAFSADSRELLTCDGYGLAAFDIATGRRTAAEWEQPIGCWLLPFAILALLICHVIATTLLFRQDSYWRALFDAWLSQASGFAIAYVVLHMSHWTRRGDVRMMNSQAIAGVTMAAWTLGIGVYFGLGPGPLWRRALISFLLCASCWGLLLAANAARGESPLADFRAEVIPLLISFVFANLIALWAIPLRWLGWSLRNDAYPGERLRFGVFDVLVATGLVAIHVAANQATDPNAFREQDLISLGVGFLVCLVPWAFAWAPLSRAGLGWRIPALVVTAALLVASVVRAFLSLEPIGDNDFARFGLCFVAIGILFLHALFLARLRGWRWTYVGPAKPPETIVSAPPPNPLA